MRLKCRTSLIDERGLRDANKSREVIVLINLRFHKIHSKHPETSLLVFAAGSTQQGSRLLVKSLRQVNFLLLNVLVPFPVLAYS